MGPFTRVLLKFELEGSPFHKLVSASLWLLGSDFEYDYNQLCLLKSKLHTSNNCVSRRSIQVLFSLFSIVFYPT